MMAAWKLAPGACRRQHRRHQAVGADAADHAEARQDHRRHLPRRRGECRHRARRHDRQRADQSPEGRHGLADRQHRHRQEGAAGRLGHDQAHASRARRQGAGDRVRRCRSRLGGRRHARRSATTTPARIAPRPAASTPARRSTTIWSPTCRAPPRSIKYNLPDDDENEIGPADLSAQQRPRAELRRAGRASRSTSSITAGGKSPGGKGFFFEPTVVAGALAGR